MKKICIASIHGLENLGGLERVNKLLKEILETKYEVIIVSGRKKPFSHGNWLLQSLLVCLKLVFIPHEYVIGTSWHSFLYPCDISFHHGTMIGNFLNLGGDKKYAKRVGAMERISGFTAKKVIAVGENVKTELIELYKIPEKKIFVLNNFVNDFLFLPARKGENTDVCKVGFSGRLEDRKGLEDLKIFSDFIEIYNKTSPKKIKLSIASNSSKNSEFFTDKISTTIKIGIAMEDMPAFYNSIDVLFFPTKYEGFSMSTLEALCCGTPVIGTCWAIGKELQEFDFCVLYDGSVDENLLEKMQELKNKFGAKRDEIHEKIQKKFGREQYQKKLLGLL